jgi:hypothetical protein
VNLRDFGQPWIPTGERSGLQTRHQDERKRFVVRSDEKLTAFLELESAIRKDNIDIVCPRLTNSQLR